MRSEQAISPEEERDTYHSWLGERASGQLRACALTSRFSAYHASQL